jgi:hypothetical protein
LEFFLKWFKLLPFVKKIVLFRSFFIFFSLA